MREFFANFVAVCKYMFTFSFSRNLIVAQALDDCKIFYKERSTAPRESNINKPIENLRRIW